MHDARDRNQGIWIEHNDRLYVAAYSSVASLVVMFSGYFRKMNGDIIEYAVTVSPTSDRAVTATTQHFGAGFLLSCVASLASGNANRGQCYVRTQIQRSAGTPAIKLHNVVGGYLSDDYSPSFPYGKIEGPLEGSGAIRGITGTDPAAGDLAGETVPTGARWRIRSIQGSLATSGVAGNRFVTCDLWTGSAWTSSVIATQAQVASTTRTYLFGLWQDRAYEATMAIYTAPLIDLILPAGGFFLLYAPASDIGDNWEAPRLQVEEWLEA